jgi:hypothetical protein
MNPSNFYLCYLKQDISEKELETVHAYWEFNRTVGEFKYKTSDYRFNKGNKAIPNISSNIGKYVFIASNSNLSCSACDQKYTASSRSKLKRLLESIPSKCNACFAIEINAEASDVLMRAESVVRNFQIPSNEHYQTYSYIDALFLLILLSECVDHNTGRVESIDGLNLTGSYEDDVAIIESLAKKNILFECGVDLAGSNFCEVDVYYLQRYYTLLNVENKGKYDDLISNMPVSGFYIVKPDHFEDCSIFMHYIFDAFLSKSITLDDLQMLEEMVYTVLKNKAYQLLPIVESDNRIVVERGLSLDKVLKHAVRHLTLPQVFNLLHFQGGEVAKYLHRKELPPNSLHSQRLFAKFVETRINKLLEDTSKGRFTRYLPKDMVSSRLETFSAAYFLDEQLSWDSLTGQAIFRTWLSKLQVTTDIE